MTMHQHQAPSPAQTPMHRFRRPGDGGYAGDVTTWNRTGSHAPAVVVAAEGVDDVVAAVRYARRHGLGLGVMATGHGTGIPADGGVLVNTSRMRGLTVDPARRTARVEPGVTWAEVNAEASSHGLIGLAGSNSLVGVVGYTVGGGFGWLGRRFGFAAQSVHSADLVTAHGDVVTVDADQHPDLLWALRGGGNFGVVTSLEFALHPVERVSGGTMLYPLRRADRVLTGYARWAERQPDAMASSVALMNMPRLPAIPPFLRGRSFTVVRACYSGEDLAVGRRLIRDLRREVGWPLLRTMGGWPPPPRTRSPRSPRNRSGPCCTPTCCTG